MKPENSTVLVTGGSAGLGAAVAATVVEMGGAVVIADLNEAAGERLVSELGERAVFVKCNVADSAGVGVALDAAERQTRPFRAVVNCARGSLTPQRWSAGQAHILSIALERSLK